MYVYRYTSMIESRYNLAAEILHENYERIREILAMHKNQWCEQFVAAVQIVEEKWKKCYGVMCGIERLIAIRRSVDELGRSFDKGLDKVLNSAIKKRERKKFDCMNVAYGVMNDMGAVVKEVNTMGESIMRAINEYDVAEFSDQFSFVIEKPLVLLSLLRAKLGLPASGVQHSPRK